MKQKPIIPELDHLSELVGEFIEYWGFKKIHGKIWTLIFLAEHPIDAKSIMDRLKISKALVSISLKDLLSYQVILEAGVSDQGTRTYIANPDIHRVIQRVLRQREKVMMSKVRGAFHELKQLPKAERQQEQLDDDKIHDLDKLLGKGERLLKTVLNLI